MTINGDDDDDEWMDKNEWIGWEKKEKDYLLFLKDFFFL